MTHPRSIISSLLGYRPNKPQKTIEASAQPDNELERLIEEVLVLAQTINEQEDLYEAYLDNKHTAQNIGSAIADSVYEAQHTSASAAQLEDQANAKAGQVANELHRLGARRRLLLAALAKRGFPTSRWVAHDGSLYHLAPSPVSVQNRGPFRLYRLPENARGQIIRGECPEITTRRVQYTTFYTRSNARVCASWGHL